MMNGHPPLFVAVNMKHIKFLSFVVTDLKRTGPIRFRIFGDGTATISTYPSFRESLRSLRRVFELSLMSLIPMLFADDGASSDEPMTQILVGKFADEDWHKTSRSAQASVTLIDMEGRRFLTRVPRQVSSRTSMRLRAKASCASVIDPSGAYIPASTRISLNHKNRRLAHI